MAQAPIKVDEATRERVRYLAALLGTSQADVVGQAVTEYAARHTELVEKGIERARSVLRAGDAAIAAHLLGVPEEAVERIAGGRRSPNAAPT